MQVSFMDSSIFSLKSGGNPGKLLKKWKKERRKVVPMTCFNIN
jgi:hypothetical protein